MRGFVLVALFLTFSGFLRPAFSQDSACIFGANQAATVYVEYRYTTNEGEGVERGSGFIISALGHILTNAHVVSPRIQGIAVQIASVAVRPDSLLEPPVQADILVLDRTLDLALLKLPARHDGTPWPTVTVGLSPNQPVGAPLIGLGFASNGDLALVPAGQKTAHNAMVDDQLKPW
jgi:S1-C subfamily serine protease